MESALFLIAIALGYKLVLDSSQSPQKSIRLAGIILGVLIATLSAFQLATSCLSGSCAHPSRMMGSKMCPIEPGMPGMGMGGGMMKKPESGLYHGMGGNMPGFQHPPMGGPMGQQQAPSDQPLPPADQK